MYTGNNGKEYIISIYRYASSLYKLQMFIYKLTLQEG